MASLADLFGITLRPRVFVSYHHGLDQVAYDRLSTLLHDDYQTITDRSLDEEIASDDCEYVMRRIREDYLTGTSCTLVLIGAQTYLRKYVDWEIKATLDKGHGLVGIRSQNPWATLLGASAAPVPWRLHDNVVSGYAVMTDWFALTQNPASIRQLVADACSRSTWRIRNDRAMMSRNGSAGTILGT